eukprot:2420536-Pleurochrysis_carterae.AAC.1
MARQPAENSKLQHARQLARSLEQARVPLSLTTPALTAGCLAMLWPRISEKTFLCCHGLAPVRG